MLEFTIINCRTHRAWCATRAEAKFYLDNLNADYIVNHYQSTLIPGEL